MPNAYAILAQVRRNLRAEGRSSEEINRVIADMTKSDYAQWLEMAAQYLTDVQAETL